MSKEAIVSMFDPGMHYYKLVSDQKPSIKHDHFQGTFEGRTYIACAEMLRFDELEGVAVSESDWPEEFISALAETAAQEAENAES